VAAIGAARAAYDRGSWSALPATERVARVADASHDAKGPA